MRRVLARLAALSLACAACRTPPPQPQGVVNIMFAASLDTSRYVTWDFDLERCQDTGDPRVDDTRVRQLMLEELASELERRGLRRVAGGPVDCLVYYEFSVENTAGDEAASEPGHARIILVDSASGRSAWMAEERAPVSRSTDPARVREGVRKFVVKMLGYYPAPHGVKPHAAPAAGG